MRCVCFGAFLPVASFQTLSLFFIVYFVGFSMGTCYLKQINMYVCSLCMYVLLQFTFDSGRQFLSLPLLLPFGRVTSSYEITVLYIS